MAPMLLPSNLESEGEFDEALKLYTTFFDTIPGVQGLGETFSFILHDQFYKPAFGHFCGKFVDRKLVEDYQYLPAPAFLRNMSGNFSDSQKPNIG